LWLPPFWKISRQAFPFVSHQFYFFERSLNPADDLSRQIDVKNMYDRWFQGPAFLQLPNSEWPSESVETIQNDPERKKHEDFATLNQIRWIFTTPRSPHQGGIYESLIKQVKSAIRIVVGNQNQFWNEMSTVLAEVKSLINGRL
jgi:hypothetical protein